MRLYSPVWSIRLVKDARILAKRVGSFHVPRKFSHRFEWRPAQLVSYSEPADDGRKTFVRPAVRRRNSFLMNGKAYGVHLPNYRGFFCPDLLWSRRRADSCSPSVARRNDSTNNSFQRSKRYQQTVQPYNQATWNASFPNANSCFRWLSTLPAKKKRNQWLAWLQINRTIRNSWLWLLFTVIHDIGACQTLGLSITMTPRCAAHWKF